MPFTLTTVTAPTDEPLSLDEVKEHLRIDGEDQDQALGNIVIAAREYCEEVLSRQLMPATLKLTLDAFPGIPECWQMIEADGSWGSITVPRPPLITLTADGDFPTLGITYVDTNGTTQTLSSSRYQVDALSEPGRITPAYGYSWPSTRAQMNAVTVIYRAGYASTDLIPKRTKQALLMLAGYWYEQREAVVVGSISKEIEFATHALLQLDRVGIM